MSTFVLFDWAEAPARVVALRLEPDRIVMVLAVSLPARVSICNEIKSFVVGTSKIESKK